MSRYQKTMREALQEVASDNETFDEAVKWEVKISGLPTFYADGKSRGEVRQALRKMLKRPDDIESIERTTPAELKKIRRGQIAGDEPGETNEEVEDAFDYRAKKGAIAAPGSGSIAKAKKPKASDVNKSIEQQMKDALKERINLDVDQVVNAIQFGHPFKVVDEAIPPELPGPEVPRYKNVSNAVVDKADKKSNKAMAKAEKDTLVPTQTKENKLPPHLAKFFDKKGNPNPAAAARMAAGRKKREEPKIKDVTPKGYGPNEEVEIDEITFGIPVSAKMAGTTKPPKQKKGFRGVGKPPAGWKTRKAGTKPGEMTTAEYDPTLGEGKMEELHALIKQGKSADDIAKTLDLDTKTVKELMPEATAAELELANAKKADKKQQGGSLRHKIWPASASMRMPKVEDAVAKVMEQEGGVTDDSGYTRYPSTGNWAGIKGKTYKKNLAIAKTKQTPQDKERDALIKAVAKSPKQQALARAQAKDKRDQDKAPVGKIRKESVDRIAERLKKKVVSEVAPPGWGHTKAEKEKTKPDKPKSKIGGSAHEFQKDLDSGKFKGLPGDKTYKDKKASMFKLMWSMKDKGDKPHYKPGEKDVLKKKYKNEGLDTWHPDPKKDKVTKHQARLLPPSPKKPIQKPRKSNVDFKDLRPQFKEVAPSTLEFRARMKDRKASVGRPKEPELLSKFLKRAKEGGYKVKKEESKLPPHLSKFFDKKGDMKPEVAKRVAAGRKKREAAAKVTDVTPKGYGPNEEENLLDSAKRYLNEKADWNTAFKSAAQSRPAMKYKDAVSFIDTAGLNSTEKRSALKAAKKWLR